MLHKLSPDQGGFDFEEVIGEVPPYKLQLIRDTGAVASKLAERGRITEIEADDVVNRMYVYVFGNRVV